MADSTLTIKTASGDLVPIAVRLNPDGGRRQVVVIGDGETANLLAPATEGSLLDLLTAVQGRLAAGEAVELGPAALAALESISAAVSGSVELGPAALAALENITATVSGPVDLSSAALAALENITATVSGPVEVDNATGGPLGVKQTGVAPPLGYQQVAALTASQALPSIPGSAVTAIVTPRAAVRWRDDGTNPTASVGMYLAADQPLTYQGNLGAVRLIAVSGSVEVNVAYYGAEA